MANLLTAKGNKPNNHVCLICALLERLQVRAKALVGVPGGHSTVVELWKASKTVGAFTEGTMEIIYEEWTKLRRIRP
jgi:hypothetical protein